MGFPRLIRQSKELQRIPNPEDFALDKTIENIFYDELRDFVGGRVFAYARGIIEHPETDTEAIRSRQEVLQSFMAHPDLIKMLKRKRIFNLGGGYDRDWDHKFRDRIELGKSYLDFVTELSEELPESQNPDLEEFRDYVVNLVSEGERLQSLRQALADIERPGKLEIQTEFVAKKSYYQYHKREVVYDADTALIQGTFSSGKQRTTSDRYGRWDNSDLNIPYSRLFSTAIQQVKEKTGKDLISWETPTKLEVRVDEERGTITGEATYTKLDFVKTLLSFRKKTKPVTTHLEFNPEEFSTSYFARAMRYLQNEEFSSFLSRYDQDVREFADAVVELRYLAAAAGYFNALEERGVLTTMPTIVESDSRKMSARNLIEPNLLEKFDLGDVVANDVSADLSENLHVITGPNNNGKTTYINSLGIAQAMGQAGLMVLAWEAEISPRENIFSHYIRPGDLVAGESRYAHELSRIKGIMKRACGNSLILMDEPCSGTSPEDAREEADAVVRTIGELGATLYVATHFHNLIDTAEELPYGGNLQCVASIDGDDLVYTYKIEEGSSNQSNGIYLARKMGADRNGLKAILTEREEKEDLQLRE